MTTFTYQGYIVTYNGDGSAATFETSSLDLVVASADSTLRYTRTYTNGEPDDYITIVSQISNLRIGAENIPLNQIYDLDAETEQISWAGGVSNIFSIELGDGRVFLTQMSGNAIPQMNSVSEFNSFLAFIHHREPLDWGYYGPNQDIPLANIMSPGMTENDLLRGDDAANTLSGGLGDDEIYGGAGDDALYGGAGSDFLFGNKGNDLIAPGSGADQVDGGLGLDRVWYGDSAGGVSVDLTTGTGARSDAAGDTYVGIERVTGSAFSDSIVGNALGNALKGGAGDDIIYGKDGRDVIEGQAGKDQLYGGAGNDNILGGDGNDKLFGNSGFDKLYGGAGNDQLTGGADADYFVFETNGATGFGGDIVLDFQNGLDKLDMRGVYLTSDPGHAPIGFADLTIGAWNDGVKIVVQNSQIVYLDHAATGITVADIDAGDFLFA